MVVTIFVCGTYMQVFYNVTEGYVKVAGVKEFFEPVLLEM
jgi:hypothetical protein